MNVGHGHPRVVEAVQEQAARFLHTDFTVIPYEGYVELAERLCALAPIAGETRAAFFNAGTEAVENAVKFARLYTGRPAVIAFEGAFHGRTLLSLTMTSKSQPYKIGIGPFAPEVYRAPYPNPYRGATAEDALAQLERMLVTHVPAEHVAAIVFEPQQGEGGFIPAPAAFVEGLRALCDRHGIVLVADEVQTGFGRTARMFAMEHYGVEPDLITVAKSIAVGSAAVRRDRARGDHGLRVTPVRSVARSSAIRSRSPPRSPCSTCSRRNGSSSGPASSATTIRERMLAWQQRSPADRRRSRPRRDAGDRARRTIPSRRSLRPSSREAVIDAALQRGLILLKAGVPGNCIRVLCPLTIADAELDEALDVWEALRPFSDEPLGSWAGSSRPYATEPRGGYMPP